MIDQHELFELWKSITERQNTGPYCELCNEELSICMCAPLLAQNMLEYFFMPK